MGLKTQFHMKMKRKEKRRAKRKKLQAKGLNMSEYFYGGFYLKETKR